jgi:hypothetical protein
LTFIALKFTILNFLGLNQNYLYKAFNDSSTSTTQTAAPGADFKKLNLSPSVVYNNDSLSLVYHLSKVTKSLSYIKPQDLLQHTSSSNQSRLLTHMYDLLPETTNK